MEKQTLENVGQYIAWGIIILGALIKGLHSSYSLIKDMFKKKKEQSANADVNNVTVNVNSPNNTHTAQPLSQDYRFLLIILLEHGTLLKEIHDMKPDILRDQLEYYRKFSQKMMLSLTDIMIELLKDAGIDDIHFGTYFSNFENFIEMCENNVKMEFRKMCKENHFSETSPGDFRKLVDGNVILLEGVINDLLRKRYPQKEFIKNFHRIYKLKADIRNGLIDCLQVARDIAIERETRVAIMKERFEKKMSEVIGEEYKVSII